MTKTRDQLERDANSLIKLVLSEMETLAGLEPAEAAEPYAFEERRRRVVRKIWALLKDCILYEPSVPVE